MGVEGSELEVRRHESRGSRKGDSLDVPLGDYGVKLQLRGMSPGPLPS